MCWLAGYQTGIGGLTTSKPFVSAPFLAYRVTMLMLTGLLFPQAFRMLRADKNRNGSTAEVVPGSKLARLLHARCVQIDTQAPQCTLQATA
eukprot:1159276-Pelagomonas_calceolata.AAC.6